LREGGGILKPEPKIVSKRLICLDEPTESWIRGQKNASAAVRKLIRTQIDEVERGRPAKKAVYII